MSKIYTTIKDHNNETLGCPTTLGKYEKLYGKDKKVENEKIEEHKNIWRAITDNSRNQILFTLSKAVKDFRVLGSDFILISEDEGKCIKAVLRNGRTFDNGDTELDVTDMIEVLIGCDTDKLVSLKEGFKYDGKEC